MSDTKTDNNVSLFFVINQNHQFSPVEKFLVKRGYTVYVESDITLAMNKINEVNPDHIFLAWDHKNKNIRLMPKTIYQSSAGQVVPFITTTQRDQIIQLEASNFENKLYPPLSGPGIIRAITKHVKQNEVVEQNFKKNFTPPPTKKDSEMIQVKSFFKSDETPSSTNVAGAASAAQLEQTTDLENIKELTRNQLQMFTKDSSNLNRSLADLNADTVKTDLTMAIAVEIDKTPQLTAVQKNETKSNLETTINNEFSQNGTQKSLSQSIENEINKIEELTPSEIADITSNLMFLVDEELNKAFSSQLEQNNTSLKKDESKTDPNNLETPLSSLISTETKKMSPDIIDSIDQVFDESIKPEILDLLETYQDHHDEMTLSPSETMPIYVLTIQELNWTGYLTLASENFLDISSAQIILNKWIKQTIKKTNSEIETENNFEAKDATLFEIRIPVIDFTLLCSQKAEVYKNIEFEGKRTVLGFFPFSPYQVINSAHKSYEMLELSVDFLQANKIVPFNASLYLPENKKFILYLKPGSFFDVTQVSRLKSRNIKYVYASMNYDLELLKYKAEFNVGKLVANYIRSQKN